MSDNSKNKVEREIVLRMTDVCTYYGAIRALNKINIEIRKGEMVCLLGGNASGKSTTLKTILGYAPPREGTIEFLGTRTEKCRRRKSSDWEFPWCLRIDDFSAECPFSKI